MKSPLLALLAAAATLVAASCASAPNTAALNAKTVPKASFGSPETHALIFGLVNFPGLLFDDPVSGLEFVQLNTKMDPMIVSPGRNGKAFFLQPVPVGAIMQIARFQYIVEESNGYRNVKRIYTDGVDIAPTAPLSIPVDKPGLIYAGSYRLGTNQGLSLKGIFLGYEDFGLIPGAKGTERDALKAVRSKFSGTAWQAVIDARLKELK